VEEEEQVLTYPSYSLKENDTHNQTRFCEVMYDKRFAVFSTTSCERQFRSQRAAILRRNVKLCQDKSSSLAKNWTWHDTTSTPAEHKKAMGYCCWFFTRKM